LMRCGFYIQRNQVTNRPSTRPILIMGYSDPHQKQVFPIEKFVPIQQLSISLVSKYSLTKNTMNGKNNVAIGFLTMGFFMAYGFLLIYLRDFAPGKEEWVNSYSIGKHFESRLAHVHGNLFAFLNILIGYLLLRFRTQLKSANTISWLALTGLLMPLGILSEVYFGLPPVLVLVGAIAMTASVIWLGIAFFNIKKLTT